MTEKRIGPRYVPAALAALGALVLLVAACEAPSPTDPAELQELTAGKQLSHVDPVDDSALQRILEEDGDVTLVVEEVDGATYVIDAVKLEEVRRKGHAELLLRKLKEHGEEGDVKLTLVHEDGTESARYGVLRRASQPEHNERVEYAPPAAEGNRLIIDKVEAAEMEMKRKKEGGSR